MKKIALTLIILILIATPAYALFESKAVKKANEYISAGMTKEAIQTLKNGILEDPKDHEAHWMLGKMYLKGGYYSGAEERFNSAILLKPDLKDQLGSLYKNTASSELAKGNIDQAISLFSRAANYDSGLRKPIGQECFNTGKKYLSPGQSGYADKLFSLAKSMDGALSNGIQEAQTNFGNQLLEIAKNEPKAERRKYVDEALKYITQQDVDQVLPPPVWVKVPGTYIKIKGKGLNNVVYAGKGISLDKEWHIVAKTKKDLIFKHYYAGRDNNYTGGFNLPTINSFTIKKGLEFFIPEGEIVEFWAERLETSY